MPDILYKVGGGITLGSVDSLQPTLAVVPGTKEFRVTPTYVGQMVPKHQAVMTLGDSREVAAAITDKYRPQLEAREQYREGIEYLFEMMGVEVNTLNVNIPRRSSPFLNYAFREGKIDYSEIKRIRDAIELAPQDLEHIANHYDEEYDMSGANRKIVRELASSVGEDFDEIFEPVYDAIIVMAGATDSDIKAIKDYILTGEADEKTLDWIAENVDPAFNKFNSQRVLGDYLEQLGEGNYIARLEESVVQIIEDIKLGNAYQSEIEIADLVINVDQDLYDLTGLKPASYFILTIDDVVEGENPGGLIVPIKYNHQKGTNVPDELKQYFMSVERLGHITTAIDFVLGWLFTPYLLKSQEIKDQYKEIISNTRPNILRSALFRAIFPDEHLPTLTLYPDGRMERSSWKDNIDRIIEIVRNDRAGIIDEAESYFGIPKEQIKFEELIALQVQLMHLTPFPFYRCADLDSRLPDSIKDTKKKRRRLPGGELLSLLAYEESDKQLKHDFNTTLDDFKVSSGPTFADVTGLFGDDFDFLKEVKGVDIAIIDQFLP